MDESTSLDQTKRQTINPLVDAINRETEPLLKEAMKEFGYELPLTFRIYNQIRFYEKYGKLKMGTSVASREQLAQQFGATIQQIDKAFDNLTSRYKLGKWVVHEKPIFRNVKRTWMSNARLQQGENNSYGIGAELLRGRSTTPTAEEFALEEPLLAESKKKVSINNIRQTSSSLPSKEVKEIVALYDELFKPKYPTQLTDKRAKLISARLKDPQGKEKLIDAITNASRSSWHRGENDHGWKADLTWIVESEKTVNKLANMTPTKPQSKSSNLFIMGE